MSASLSSENVGEANYVKKVNLRRILDQEARREGWKLFAPDSAGGALQSFYDGTETLLRIAELIRPNGERVVVAASRTKIKRFNTSLGTWDVIGSGYSSAGARWQAVSMNGYLILNNKVDLLVSYRVEWTATVPVYELREVGIASVGTVTENNGCLILANITEIQEDQLNAWMHGYSNYAATTTVVENASWTAVNADSGTEFDAQAGNTDMVMTLPANPSSTFFVWVKKTVAGTGVVTTSPVIDNQAVALKILNDSALVWWDPVLQKYTAKTFAQGVIPAFLPYGAVPSDIVNVIPWKIINGEFGDPIHWAPNFEVVMSGASATVTLPFASKVFIPGQTRVAVVNGGPDSGVLGGDSLHPNGILVTAVAGNTITLEISTDTGISYPRTVEVTRWTDTSTLVTSYELQGDGSAIITVLTLQNQAVVYRETGIYVGRYTGFVFDALGNKTGPYAWRERYKGANVPIWGDAVVSVRDDYHVYPSQGQHFYQFDGSTEPALHPQLDVAREIFFSTTLAHDEEIWATVNPVTSEVWFMRPGVNTLAYDYITKTCSEIDVGFNAAAYVHRPGAWLDNWFIIGLAGTVSTYGRVEGQAPFLTWLRNGQPANFQLKNGLCSMAAQQRPGYPSISDELNEKDLVSYTPVLASQSPDFAFAVQIYATWNPNETPAPLLNPPALFPDPAGMNYLTLFYRSIYFQVEITGQDTRDIDFRFSSHLFEVDRLSAGGINRRPDV